MRHPRYGAGMNNHQPGRFRLSLLGRFELTGLEGRIEFRSRKASGLLAFLACATSGQQHRERLCNLLWGSHSERQARQNLRQTLFLIRQLLGAGSVIGNGHLLSLQPHLFDCDVHDLDALLGEGTRGALAAAVALHKGPFLSDLEIAEDEWGDWLTTQRQRFEDLTLNAMVRLGELELAAGHPEAAAATAQRAIAENEIREDAHRVLMRALAASGRRPDALRHYDQLSALLKRELDVKPDAATTALACELRGTPASSITVKCADPMFRTAARQDRGREPDDPSIAVFPFTNVGADADQDNLADGFSGTLVTELSRVRWLRVIGGGAALDQKQAGPELGVRYMVEGSVRRSGMRLRINVQLVDASSGRCRWAERYDRTFDDILTLQDEFSSGVAAAIESHVLMAEGARALSRSEHDLSPWEVVARAKAHYWRLTKADAKIAIASLSGIAEAVPDYAAAQGLLGFCLVNAAHMGWIDRAQGLAPGREHAIRAIALDACDPWGHTALGYWAMMERRTEESLAALRQAVDLNPNSPTARTHLSRGLAFAGHFNDAIEQGEQAIRLGKFDPDMAFFLGGIAVAQHAAGRFEDAIRWSIEAQRLRPSFQGSRRMLCANLALAGRTDEARTLVAAIKRDQPELSLEWMTDNVPYQTPSLIDRYLAGMWKAGLR